MTQPNTKVGHGIDASTGPSWEGPAVPAPDAGDQAGLEAPSASSQDSELATSTTQTSERPSHVVE